MFVAWFLAQDSDENYFLNGILDTVGQGFCLEDPELETVPDEIRLEIFETRADAEAWLSEHRAMHEPLPDDA